ncbi:MBL fold metallo-hydrolase [Actinomadura craniellae]|uniref:MBL fold metallo-hydrolase n=1 Tax=Actinomadura craniellae TaxID=2231787 RepID=A0A365HBH1_9ACTN|nr:MBL fold metallo-hydrolase [Actinomadura craniellae]RAY16389.1 MBL fold metallo-hydrolase [Actinomadura craniellae]
MRVHHLNCGTMLPLGGWLMGGQGHPLSTAPLVTHCLLIETDAGLVLVDTGFGMRCVEQPVQVLGRQFMAACRPRLDPAETALRQVIALGHSAEDVRHIVLTHLDLDHAGGLADFPHATVHLHETERQAAAAPSSVSEKQRYRPIQWEHGPDWRTYSGADGERWFGFEAVRELAGLPEDILLVPLAGHSRGHTGVAVRTGDRWLLHAGDAFFFRGEVDPARPYCPPGLRVFQTVVQEDGAARHTNRRRLADLVGGHGDQVDVFCAHDLTQLRETSRL